MPDLGHGTYTVGKSRPLVWVTVSTYARRAAWEIMT